ncbi:MAG: rod shape-determining protein MreC [Patescibacteria group bacterium]|nr:rod shape-determining protein MreC [Patescibacteria group bacterium]
MPRRKSPWFARPLAVAFMVSAMVIALHQMGWIAPLEGIVVRLIAPLQWVIGAGGNVVAGTWTNQRGRQELLDENQRYRELVDRLVTENQELKRQLSIEELLKEQADFLLQRRLSAVPAHVIARDFGVNVQTMVIDRGTLSGIQVGFPVIAQEGTLIGKIFEVGREHAKVLLLTDGRSVVSAALGQDLTVEGSVSGDAGPSLKLDLIPKAEELTAGDLVVTAGIDPPIPAGLLIGSVTRVESAPSAFFHVAHLQPPIPYQTLSVVSVILGGQADSAGANGLE